MVLGLVMGLLLFASAGTFDYWQAWVYLAVFVGSSALITVDLMRRDPALLGRRMRGGPVAEREPRQRVIMLFASLGFISLLVVPGLDRRFGWSAVPVYAVWLGNVMILVGFWFIARVYRENTFTSATIEVAENQTVVTTGPYRSEEHTSE